VVLIRMELRDEASGEKQVRTGCGFLIRCDGFLLVPPKLVSLDMTLSDGKPGRAHTDTKRLNATFCAADGELPKPQDLFQPRHNEEVRDFTALKVNGHHFKALQMLHPRNIKPGLNVRVVYAVPDPDKPGTAKPVSIPARVGTGYEPDTRKLRFTFADGPVSVPSGAVVVDAATGLAIGQVPGDEKQVDADDVVSGTFAPKAFFASFAEVYKTQNAIALLPDPKARASEAESMSDDARKAVPGNVVDGMVYVPGGPIDLEDWRFGNLLSEYKLLYGVTVACTPGFWIDQRAVTAGEYAEFLQATRYRPLPAGWTDASVAEEYAAYPVSGVSPQAAAEYALAKGKRLVTPVEWLKAKQMRSFQLYEEEYAAIDALGAEFAQIDQAEAQLIFQRKQEAAIRAAQRRVPLDPNASYTGPELQAFMAERVGRVREFVNGHGFLIHATPAGSNPKDVSMYGVRDVNSNTPEWLLQNEGKIGRDVAGKQLVITPTGASESYGPPIPERDIRQVTTVDPARPRNIYLRKTNPALDAFWQILLRHFGDDPIQDMLLFKMPGLGFRCAR
jgi:Uncharacterized conserved protein